MSKVIYLPIKSTEFTKRLLRKRTPFDRFCFSQDMKIPYIRLFSPLMCQFCFWRLSTGKAQSTFRNKAYNVILQLAYSLSTVLQRWPCSVPKVLALPTLWGPSLSVMWPAKLKDAKQAHTAQKPCASFLCLAQGHAAMSFQQMFTKTRPFCSIVAACHREVHPDAPQMSQCLEDM